MPKYLASLRAILVSGNLAIKMADLKRMFGAIGLENIQMYIQSGIVIFESDQADVGLLEARIESQLQHVTGYRVRHFVRKLRTRETIATTSPFIPGDEETVHVVFLNQEPAKDLRQALLASRSETDDFAIKGREVCTLRRDRKSSVFSNNFIEKVRKLPATTRNLTTFEQIVRKYE